MAHVSAIDVARKANGKRGVNRSFLIACPVPGHGRGRGDLSPSCTIRDGHDGRPIFHCFAGCDWRDVVHAARERGWIDPNSAWPSRLSSQQPHSRPHASKPQATKTAEIAREIWKAASPLKGSPAQRYLVEARRIANPPMDRLRFHPRVWHSDVKMHLPALVAPIFRTDRQELQGVHIIYLMPNGAGKATAQPSKRTLGRLKGGGVWLGVVMDTVVVAEGIETALSVQRATCTPSVATLSAHTMASLILPERVRSVIIAADPGHVGERCAYDAAERWACRGLHCLHRQAWRSLMQDFNDQLQEEGPDAVRASVNSAAPHTLEPPLPLIRDLPPAPPFPIAALSPRIQNAALSIHAATQAPMDICANAVAFAGACLATQPLADVRLPTGEVKPLSLYFVTVAKSGERKTSVEQQPGACRHQRARGRASARVRRRARILRKRDSGAGAGARQDQSQQEAGLRPAQSRDGGIGRGAHRSDLACGYLPEPTFEGLIRLLAHGQPSVGVFTSEGGVFVGGHGFTDEAKVRTGSGLSLLWDDGSMTRVRAGDGVIALVGRRVAMHLQVQPGVAARLLGDRVLLDQGLLSRVLISAPEIQAKGQGFGRSSSRLIDEVLSNFRRTRANFCGGRCL